MSEPPSSIHAIDSAFVALHLNIDPTEFTGSA